MKDLGCMNGWQDPTHYPFGWDGPAIKGEDRTPEEYKACSLAGHEVVEVKIGNCYYRCTCSICQITYTVDSSD